MAIADNTTKLTQLLDLINNLPDEGSTGSGSGIVDVEIEEVTANG